jgi:hypothetical protein
MFNHHADILDAARHIAIFAIDKATDARPSTWRTTAAVGRPIGPSGGMPGIWIRFGVPLRRQVRLSAVPLRELVPGVHLRERSFDRRGGTSSL